jgi:hypothetical protein
MNMRHFLCGLIFAFFSYPVYAIDGFTGQWSGENVVNDQNSSTLTLDIIQKGDVINGQYCYVTQNGNRIDCPDDDTINLHGKVKGSSSIINFDSSFGAKNGKAKITIDDNKMKWEILIKPEGGRFYAPEKYDLTKKETAVKDRKGKGTLVTDKFIITVENPCGELISVCDNIKYHGLSKKEGDEISLTGKTSLNDNGKVDGAVFVIGNFTYHVYYDDPRLQVFQNGKMIVNQSGYWK